MRAAVVRHDLDLLTHVPAQLAAAVGTIDVLLVATGFVFLPVIGQDIRRNRVGIVRFPNRQIFLGRPPTNMLLVYGRSLLKYLADRLLARVLRLTVGSGFNRTLRNQTGVAP